jgi:CMP-N-acetylneuraminic acid synthetase
MNSKILAVIPARGGSKGVARKNVRLLAGKPLLAYSIEAALAVRDRLVRVILSTDDPAIAEVGRACGADVPFFRPAELGGDRTPMVPVLQHAVREIESRDSLRLDWVLLLQPTAPLRSPADIRAAIALAEAGGCDSVISVVQVFAVHPILMKRIEGDRLLPFCMEEKEGTRRQDYQPPAYMRNGAIYLTRRDVLMERGSIWGEVIRPYVMPEERSVSIDNELDFRLAELMLGDRTTPKGAGG